MSDRMQDSKMDTVVSQTEEGKDRPKTDYDVIAMGYIAKDAEWHAYKTKKLLWKVDLRLLPW